MAKINPMNRPGATPGDPGTIPAPTVGLGMSTTAPNPVPAPSTINPPQAMLAPYGSVPVS